MRLRNIVSREQNNRPPADSMPDCNKQLVQQEITTGLSGDLTCSGPRFTFIYDLLKYFPQQISELDKA